MIRAAILLPLALASVPLTGCKSTDAFMDLAPREVLKASGNPKDVAFCIGTAQHAPAKELDDGSRVIRVPTMYGGSGEAFTVRADASSSIVEYRRANGLLPGPQAWRKCLA